ncbi:hypothetical protein CRUP_033954 [Coryphaenoides rupestris]|nr:hypothetical protein CRUP_033954 [Coryphaenoides rupestris]
MEGRCSVETWLQLPYAPRNAIGGLGAAGSLGVMGGLGVICDGSEELHVFHVEDKRIVASPCDVMTPPVLTVSSDWLAVGEEGVCSLLLVGSVLLTLIQKEQQWLFSLYSVLPAAAGGSPAGRHQRAGLLELPVLSTGLVGGEPGGRPVMKCVQSSDEAVASSASSSSRGDGHLLLDSLLFRVLFGADAALARSPMILCGLPDGRLCSFPLCGLPSPRLSILHSLDQPLVFIGTSVTTGTDPSPPRCLVVVGGLGRVVLIRAGEMTSTSTTTSSSTTTAGRRLACNKCHYTLCLACCGVHRGLGLGCWADGRRLYYSTGSDLLALDLSGGPGQRGGGATAPHGDGGEGEAGGDEQLLALSAKGRLQTITLPGGGGGGGELPSLPSSQVGQRIKDLLAAIGGVCERAAALKASVCSTSRVLRGLNQLRSLALVGAELAPSRSMTLSATSGSRARICSRSFRVDRPGDGGSAAADVASADPLRAFLSAREVEGRSRTGDPRGAPRTEAGEGYSACVRVPSELLSAALWGSKVAPSELCWTGCCCPLGRDAVAVFGRESSRFRPLSTLPSGAPRSWRCDCGHHVFIHGSTLWFLRSVPPEWCTHMSLDLRLRASRKRCAAGKAMFVAGGAARLAQHGHPTSGSPELFSSLMDPFYPAEAEVLPGGEARPLEAV